MPESLFWCFLVDFEEFVRTPFLKNSTRGLLLIKAVSVVAKGVLANETVNYDTQTNAHVLIWTRSVSYQKGSPGERIGFRSSCLQTSD